MDLGALIGGGGGAAGGLLAGIVIAKKFLNGKPVPQCPSLETMLEVKTACRLLREATEANSRVVERNSKVSEEATSALLTVVKALVSLQEGKR